MKWKDGLAEEANGKTTWQKKYLAEEVNANYFRAHWIYAHT